jgi:hypothetical protein
MNYQKMRDAPMNYQLDQIEHSTTKDNHFSPFRQLEVLKETVNESCAVLHWGMLEDGGSSWGEKRKMVVVHRGERERK